MRYILNSAVITTPGRYQYRLIGIEDAKKWLNEGPYFTTIPYWENGLALSKITGLMFFVDKTLVRMHQGDEALVFRLTCRRIDPDLKIKLTPEFILQNCEMGILKKEEGL